MDAELDQVYGPQRVGWADLEAWIAQDPHPQDAVVIEMTTNTWQVYDELAAPRPLGDGGPPAACAL